MNHRCIAIALGAFFMNAGAQNVVSLAPAPAALTSIFPRVLDLTAYAQRWIDTVATINAARSLGVDLGIDEEDPSVVLADGVLAEEVQYCMRFWDDEAWKPLPGYAECHAAIHGAGDETPAMHAFMHAVYASSALRDAAFAWLKPAMQSLFTAVTQRRKATLCEITGHGIDYAAKIEADDAVLECEKKYARIQDPKGYSGSEFRWYPPRADCATPNDDKPAEFRKLEAWIYRRVVAGHLTAKELRDWFTRVKGEVLVCDS